jgi:hypothetical protein
VLSARANCHQIRRLLDVIPLTPVGLRDRAIIVTLVLTGRLQSEHLSPAAALNPKFRQLTKRSLCSSPEANVQ